MLHPEDPKAPAEEKGLLPLPSTLGPPRLRSPLRRILRFLAPSFLSRSDGHSRDVVRPTDFLDGMRGYAAFAVFFHHFCLPAHPKAHVGYGGGDGLNDHWLTQLPVIHHIYSGQACVFLFFVISRFSISLKPVSLARRGSFQKLFEALGSAVFRRTCRLYFPCVTALLITLVMACCGAFKFAYQMRQNWPFPGGPLTIPTAYNTTTEQVRDFAGHLWVWVDPLPDLKRPKDMPYATQMWTIPVELRCSFITWLAIMGLARAKSIIRMGTITAIAVYFHLRKRPEAPLFLAGTILAELHLIRQEINSSPSRESKWQKSRNVAIFVFGLALNSYPRHGGSKALFFSWVFPLARMIVGTNGKLPLYFFTSIASTMLVYIVSVSPILQRAFTTPVARYLGKISFSFYLVHQALINWIGYRNILFWWWVIGKDSVWQYELGLGIAFLIQVSINFWAADVFWRAVDAPSVKLTRWIEDKCMGHI